MAELATILNDYQAPAGASVQLRAGDDSGGFSGSAALQAGSAVDSGNGGTLTLASGTGGATSGYGGPIAITAGYSVDGAGGDINIDAGNGVTPGNIILGASLALPILDPGVQGALWNDAGTLKISAG